MYWESAITSLIEVAIGLAGFSGIFAAIARRDAGRWTPRHQARFTVLLSTSASAVFFGVLALILADAIDDLVWTWRIGSALYALWLAFVMIIRVRAVREADAPVGSPMAMIWWPLIGGVVVILQILNAALLGESWPYVVAMLYQLSVGFATFAFLLRQTWHPAEER